MNPKLATELMKQMQVPHDAPGSITTFLAHPCPAYRNKVAVQLGIVIEHRFAFCHWLRMKQELLRKLQCGDDAAFAAPDLVSFDWHDDSGTPDDYDETQLKQLNQADENEVALFAWAGLSPINDGHIRPAVWLNAIGNVYIVTNDGWDDDERDEMIRDRFGKDHGMFFCRTPREFAKVFGRTTTGAGVVWDLDLDYLTCPVPVPDQQYTHILSNRQIKSRISPRSPWMQLILENLQGVTVALEPEYTGGLSQSLHLIRQWERTFFTASVFEKHCSWRDDIFG
jgi:hypothetical protein